MSSLWLSGFGILYHVFLSTRVDHESCTMYFKAFELTMHPVPCILRGCFPYPEAPPQGCKSSSPIRNLTFIPWRGGVGMSNLGAALKPNKECLATYRKQLIFRAARGYI